MMISDMFYTVTAPDIVVVVDDGVAVAAAAANTCAYFSVSPSVFLSVYLRPL